MKFTCNLNELKEAVTNVSLAIPQKSTMAALEGVLLECYNGSLKVSGYNLELGITTSIKANILTEGEIILNAKIFSDILRKTSGTSLSFSVDDKNLVTIIASDTHYTILGIETEDYPEIPIVIKDQSFSINESLLKNMINQTSFAVSTNEQIPIQTGCLFDIDYGILNLVSVDGIRLAKRTERINVSDKFYFVVPGKTLNEINKLLKDESEENVTVYVTAKHIMFDINGFFVVSRLLEGRFLEYQSAIPQGYKTRVKVSTRDFINIIERAAVIINDRVKCPIKSVFENNTISVSCFSTMGKFHDKLFADITGEVTAVTLGFNNKYMTDALKATECDEVYLEITDPVSPIKITPLEGESFLYLVLPVRLKIMD